MKRGLPLIAIALTLFGAVLKANSEVTLYSGKGKAAAYLATDTDMTIYLWNGKPVAYLDPNRMYGGFNVYGFNGTHLGWYDRGVIWDRDGNASCAVKERSPRTEVEPFKLSKELKPYRASKQIPPYRHTFSQTFGTWNCGSLLGLGAP